MRHVALLRSLNVGSHNRITMKDLESVFRGVGCSEVEAYIQSGNVLFKASAPLVSRVPDLVAFSLKERFHIESPVLVRTPKELASIARHNPFLQPGIDQATLHVCFLSNVPAPEDVRGLDPARSKPNEFRVLGQEIYLRCPRGLGKSKLTNAWFEAQLGTQCTVRNWNTVCELAQRAQNETAPLNRRGG